MCVLLSARCRLQADAGPGCDVPVQLWFYDSDVAACSPFWYGGCGGNANRFTTEGACLQACGGQRKSHLGSTPPGDPHPGGSTHTPGISQDPVHVVLQASSSLPPAVGSPPASSSQTLMRPADGGHVTPPWTNHREGQRPKGRGYTLRQGPIRDK